MLSMKTFAYLFKKYRLRAEFETFSAFGDALAEKGYFYEESIFSHWQKGTRVPSNRQLVLCIIEIFKQRDSLKTIDEANALLASVGMGYLTDKEKEKLAFVKQKESPFQVPSEIAYFTGRKELLSKVQKEIKNGKIVILHGSPGVGKTALAIKLGHMLQENFSDGILWYKVDATNIMDILLSIARLFGEDISGIKDVTVRSSIVRTLLTKRKVLFIFDNVSKEDTLHLLLPNTATSGVIFSTRESDILFTERYVSLPVHLFTETEVILLFKKVFDKTYVTKNKKVILAISEKVGNLPLAVNIAAANMKQFMIAPAVYLRQLDESFDLHSLKYEDKDLLQAVNIGYSSLDSQTSSVFASLGIFEGKDFPIAAVAFINKLSVSETEKILVRLLEIAFIERSKSDRYRIHPLLKLFAREQIKANSVYLRAAAFYEQILNNAQEKKSYKTVLQDTENIVAIFKKCYEFGYWDQIITLWNPLEEFLSDTNEVKQLRSLTQTIDTAPNITKLQKVLIIYMPLFLIYVIVLYFTGWRTTDWNYMCNIFVGLPPFIGGFIGIIGSKHWGLFNTNIGKAIFFFSIGLFSWGSGNMIWAYYNFFQNVGVPYPSLADLGYFPAYFFWITGIIFLSRATGARIKLLNNNKKLLFLIIPISILVFSDYYLLFIVKRIFDSDTPIQAFLDFYYPSMDIVILTFAIIIFGLSVNFFRGKYKLSLFAILTGFVVLFIADFTFSYTTTFNIYYNGSIPDVLFTFGQALLTWGTLSFYLTPKKT